MAAMTYNWQRCDVYTYLGKPLERCPPSRSRRETCPPNTTARTAWLDLSPGRQAPEAAKWTD